MINPPTPVMSRMVRTGISIPGHRQLIFLTLEPSVGSSSLVTGHRHIGELRLFRVRVLRERHELSDAAGGGLLMRAIDKAEDGVAEQRGDESRSPRSV